MPRGPEEGPGVQICDKGPDRSHPHEAKPHDSKVLAHAVWGLEVLCCRSGHQQADPPKEPGAADLRGTVINGPPLLPQRSRPEAHLGARPGLFITLDQQIEDSDLPAPRWTGRAQSGSPRTHRAQTCQRPGGQERHCPLRRQPEGSDLPAPRWTGRAQSASPPAHKAPTCRHPSNGIERRSRLAPWGCPPCPCLRSHDTQTSQK